MNFSWAHLFGDHTGKRSAILSRFDPAYYYIGVVDVLRLAENFVIQKGLTGSIVFVLHFLLFPSGEGRERALNSEYKLTRTILQIVRPSYHLNS